MRILEGLLVFVVVTLAIAALCALVGAIVAAVRGGTPYTHAIGWAMWIGGAVIALLVAQSGSTTHTAGRQRIVVGGRFVEGSDIPQPQSPWIIIPAGFAVVALGLLIYVA